MKISILKLSAFSIILCICIGFSSCKKDDDNSISPTSTTSYFAYNGNNLPLNKGFFIEYGYSQYDSIFEFDVYMYSGMTIYDPDSVVGSGNVIGFNIYCTSSTIASATYTFSEDMGLAGTFAIGHFLLKWDPSAEEWQDWIYIESGTISITNNNNSFDISFDCVCEFGKSVKGRYVGVPVFFDGSK